MDQLAGREFKEITTTERIDRIVKSRSEYEKKFERVIDMCNESDDDNDDEDDDDGNGGLFFYYFEQLAVEYRVKCPENIVHQIEMEAMAVSKSVQYI